MSEGERLEDRKTEMAARFKEFIHKRYNKEINKAALEDTALDIDFNIFSKFSPELADLLMEDPVFALGCFREAVDSIDLPRQADGKPANVINRFYNHPSQMNIRDLRSRNLRKFICVEGTVRKASEIRPEIMAVSYECPDCSDIIVIERRGNFIGKPVQCNCGNRKEFRKVEDRMIDTRWIVIEEPFELTEGDRPSQLTILLTDDIVSQEGRRVTDPGNRIRITGTLMEVPKGKLYSAKLDFYLEANHVEPVEIGWHHLNITEEDKENIRKLAKESSIYEILVDSLAPTLYGMREIKESVILQLFGGVPRRLKDGSQLRGDIHILAIGDPASGKSQLLKLVPEIVPRGRYVSGKGVTGAGLTATVTKDEQFMGGWVLEAGALVLANKGLLSIDEFEKMTQEDQVAMHEALEQGTISIAKASIVATLPAKTAVLAGGNPKFSRFDPFMPISKQITISDTLLSRFDLKFALRDVPDAGRDKSIVDHVLRTREEDDYEGAIPKLDRDFVRKYIAFARETCKPALTRDASKYLRNFYLKTRKKVEGATDAIPITMRQFEALIRLAEASAKIQLQPEVRKEDAQRAIKLMKFSLRQLGMDPETGEIDIDRSEGGTTSSERSRIRVILDIINKMSETKKELSMEEIRSEAASQGVEERDAEEVIEKLKSQGLLFEPSPGFVQKI